MIVFINNVALNVTNDTFIKEKRQGYPIVNL